MQCKLTNTSSPTLVYEDFITFRLFLDLINYQFLFMLVLPLGATALGEHWSLQQPVSIAFLC
jgi:hypothetical protein